MRAVVQRVSFARVLVGSENIAEIGPGLLVYLGIADSDTARDGDQVADKIANLRILPDADGIMNKSVLDAGGEILVVSQFTLLGDTRKGRRPSYVEAASSETGKPIYDYTVTCLKAFGVDVKTGIWQATMTIESANQGPVTILLDTHKRF